MGERRALSTLTTPEPLSRALGRLTSTELISVDADLVTLLDRQGLEDLVSNAS